jgi:hypothetical protein
MQTGGNPLLNDSVDKSTSSFKPNYTHAVANKHAFSPEQNSHLTTIAKTFVPFSDENDEDSKDHGIVHTQLVSQNHTA